MKTLLFTLSFFSLSTLLFGQRESSTSLNVLFGKNTSTFGFLNSDGLNTKDLEYTQGSTFEVGVEFTLADKHLVIPEILYYEAGAKSDFEGTPLSWKLNYIGLGCGYGYKMVNKSRFSIIPGFIIGADYLTKGIQTIGLNRYDVQEIDAISNWNIRSNVFLNNRLKVSEFMSIMFEYRFGISLNQIEKKDADIDQKTRNIGHHFLLGLNIQL
jgi:hypothetical protein